MPRTLTAEQLTEYCVADGDALSFIRANDFLLPLLAEIPPRVKTVFGDNVKLALKLKLSDEPEVWVLIQTELSAREAFPLLDQFDNEYWLDNLERAQGKLNVRLEYV